MAPEHSADTAPDQLQLVTLYWDGTIETECFDTSFVLDHFEEMEWYAREEGHDFTSRVGNLLTIGTDKWSITTIEPCPCDTTGHLFNTLGQCLDCSFTSHQVCD